MFGSAVPPRPERTSARGAPAALAGITLLAVLAALGWVFWKAGRERLFDGRGGLSARLRLAAEFPASGRFQGDPYAGSRACAECHPGEHVLYTGSGHARTLRSAAETPLARRLSGRNLPDPEDPSVRWSYELHDGEFRINRNAGGKIERFVADYAFGSGHHASTFVTVRQLDPPRALEHRLTHFTEGDRLGITPGQERGVAKPGTTGLGCEMFTKQTVKCFSCHVTELSGRADAPVDPETMIPGVTCERCHGPARAHVEAMRRGEASTNLALASDPGRWDTRRQLEFCGRCHRHPDRVPPEELNPNDPTLARFQPIGLMQSRCFKGSNGALSCLSCHDPHARSSPDTAYYEQVCLGCHSSGHAAEEKPARAAPCPVSPTQGCLGCHMPRIDAGQHILFSDHWIRVRQRPASEGIPPREVASFSDGAASKRGSVSGKDLQAVLDPCPGGR